MPPAGNRRAPRSAIAPNLSVRHAVDAISFYARAFDATEERRWTAPGGNVVAELSMQGSTFFIADESPEHGNLSPESLGGTSVRLDLLVDDPDTVAERAVAAGATLVFPVDDQPWGYRMGRVADPFGHHWLIGRPLREP